MSSYRNHRVLIVRAIFTFIVVLLIIGVDSEFTSQPSSGDCVCSITTVHGRRSGSLSSEVLVTLSPGACGTFHGGIVTQDGYTWYEVQYGDQRVWVAGNYLKHSPASSRGSSNVASLAAGCPRIISRSQWGARASRSVTYLSQQPVRYAFIHHSATSECNNQSSCSSQVQSFQRYHMDTRGWDDIGYSFLIGGDGSVYKGRGWDRVGAHTKGYNSVGLGFCLIGTFTTRLPPQIQMDTVKQLIACGVSKGKIQSNYVLRGHRDMVVSTECPGNRLYSFIKGWPHY